MLSSGKHFREVDMDIQRKVLKFIGENQIFSPGEIVVVGVSGGPDSLCLLHLLFSLREELAVRLLVGHLNHGLRGEEAEGDAQFVASLAREWGLAASIEKRDVQGFAKSHKLSLEEAARRVRYSFLAEVAEREGAHKVAVGHHADDQVESVVMHWLRGAGLAGLRGMAPLQSYSIPGYPGLLLARPLLGLSRSETEAYCQEQGIKPRFDLSNLDTTLFRNRIRHELLPLLERYNPQIRRVLLRTSRVLADEYAYLEQQAEEVWGHLLVEKSNGTLTFDLAGWSRLTPNLQRQILRRAMQVLRAELRNIDWEHIEPARQALLRKPPGTTLTLPQGLSLYRDYDRLVIGDKYPAPELPLLAKSPLMVAVPGSTQLWDWRLLAEIGGQDMLASAQENTDPWQAYLDLGQAGEEIYLRSRRPGDRFQPMGMGGQEKSLHKFLIDSKIPRHIRDAWPLVVNPHHILWVGGLRVDERVRVQEKTRRILRLQFLKS